jgi:chemotaxis family two-component system sensor kinase Cph1
MDLSSEAPLAAPRFGNDRLFEEGNGTTRIIPGRSGSAAPLDHKPFADFGGARESSDQGVLDYPALLKEEREAHSAALADRDRLLAIFSHDLKTLLNAMTLNSTIALMSSGDSMEKGAANVRVILGRMDRMISNLLDLARMNAGKLRVVPRSLDAAKVVREAVKVFRPLAEEKRQSLRLAETGGPFGARLDHDRIFQVLSNLLSNAIKFSPPEGEILVSLATVDRRVQITVRDFGPGIEEDDLERIFECYRQLDGADVTGLGLGLFISKSIIEAHGGRIWVSSRPGRGSTFFFTLPGSEPVRTPRPKTPEREPVGLRNRGSVPRSA